MWGDSIEHRDPRREYAGASVLCVTIGLAALISARRAVARQAVFRRGVAHGVRRRRAAGVGGGLDKRASDAESRNQRMV